MFEDVNYGKKTIYKNSVLSVVYKFASMAISFVSAPLVLKCLGQEKYGVWASLLSIVSWIYYFDLGIGNGLRNKLATSIANNDEKTSKKLLAVSYVLISLMALGIFVIAFVVLHFFDVGKALEIDYLDENVNTIILVALLFACINFVASLANNTLYALQRSSAVSFFNVLGQLFYLLAMVIYLSAGSQLLLLVAIAEGGAQLLKNIVESIYVYGENKELRFTLKNLDFSYSKGIMTFGLQVFAMNMAALVLNTGDNLIITKFLGAADVTPYNFCYKYFGMINSVFVAIITPLLSAYTAALAKNDIKWIYRTLKKNLMLYGVFFIGTIICGFIFEPFAKLWLQQDLGYDFGLIFYTGLYYILLMFTHCFSTLLMGVGMIGMSTILNVAEAVLNIPISIFLAVNCGMGVNGVILGSVICMAMGAVVYPILSVKAIRKIKKQSMEQ